jgi:phosphoribosyl-ATP pyrophosphohydrolase/phosphoribosyl-AMP cyclohydrolase
VKLFDDPKLIGEKIQEEAEEVARAGRDESDERVAEETADLLYHLSVLLASREVPLSAAMEVLNGRRG